MIIGTVQEVITEATRKASAIEITVETRVMTPIEVVLDQNTADMSETLRLRNLDCLYMILVPVDVKYFVGQRVEIKIMSDPLALVEKKHLVSVLFQ